MRQLQITQKGHLVNQALQHNFGIITSVSNLIKHDMIYIYHHMKIGDPVMLKEIQATLLNLLQLMFILKDLKLEP